MFTLVMAQRLGLESDLTLGLSLFEGVCLTVALMLLAERYLFSRTPIAQVGEAGVVAAVADTGLGARSRTQS